jgi:hypothetical protein
MPKFSTEFWVETALALLFFVFGTALALTMLDRKTKGEFYAVIVCFTSSSAIVIYGIEAWQVSTPWSMRARALVSFLLIAGVLVLTGECVRWARGRHMRAEPPPSSTQAPTAKTPEKPPTMLDLFLGDFPSTVRTSDNEDAFTIRFNDGAVTRIKRRVYMDFDAKTKFIGFYVRASVPPAADLSGDKTMKACIGLVENGAVQKTFDDFGKNVGVLGGQGDQMTNMKDLVFSGRVFLYHDDFLSITQRAEIIKAYERKHMDVNFRGPDYLGEQVIAWHHEHSK